MRMAIMVCSISERGQRRTERRLTMTRKLTSLAAGVSLLAAEAWTSEPVFPVKVSEDHRGFVDQNSQPVFWLGTTQWELFRKYTLDEARTILQKSKEHGFLFLQVMVAGVGDGTGPAVDGQKPWLHDDPLTPSEEYFRRVDAVLRMAEEERLIITLAVYHQTWRKLITVKNARRWASWLGARYRASPSIVWSACPEAKAEYVPVLRELAAGLREGDGGRHLITLHPDPSPASSSFVHEMPWLDFNSIQTWKDVELIVPMVAADRDRTPVKPALLAEGAYEAGSEYGFEVTPLWVRRQAYDSYLAGGHFAYGHNDSWRVLPTWRKALDAPGAIQMGILQKTFLELKEWWWLVPDQSIFKTGGNTRGKVANLAARHPQGKWCLVYLAAPATVSIDLTKLSGAERIRAKWIDPRSGEVRAAGQFPKGGGESFTCPEGWEDALLVLEPASS
jgi:uncharacterized protein DUF4038/collagenase-like protein with putative collagen-binding domain